MLKRSFVPLTLSGTQKIRRTALLLCSQQGRYGGLATANQSLPKSNLGDCLWLTKLPEIILRSLFPLPLSLPGDKTCELFHLTFDLLAWLLLPANVSFLSFLALFLACSRAKSLILISFHSTSFFSAFSSALDLHLAWGNVPILGFSLSPSYDLKIDPSSRKIKTSLKL